MTEQTARSTRLKLEALPVAYDIAKLARLLNQLYKYRPGLYTLRMSASAGLTTFRLPPAVAQLRRQFCKTGLKFKLIPNYLNFNVYSTSTTSLGPTQWDPENVFPTDKGLITTI